MNKQKQHTEELFKHGSRWLRADFHLHTKADKEAFIDWNDDERRSFKTEYIHALKQEDIRVGVITNHNKFDYGEYKSLRQQARKEEIYLLPGVEFSVNDGQSGVHVCIIFEPESWLLGEDDFINRLLNQAYPNLTEPQRANRNAHSDWSLKELLEELNDIRERHHRDSFVILAHVDQNKGFFKELNESRIKALFNEALFQKYVLGFQKVTSRDSLDIIEKYFNDQKPAIVEGCDCKGFKSVGKTRNNDGKPVKSFIKIGDYNFSAVKYALIDGKRNRLGSNAPEPENAFLKNVRFETSADAPLAKKELKFNSDLNCLIGIRGSGKSTVLEAVRFGLGKNLSSNTSRDREYKESLIQHTLRSGGKIILELENRHGQQYRIERIYGERPTIYRDETALPQFAVDENLISVLYFGQKDLSEIGTEGFSQSLMEKFFGANVGPVREKIEEKEKKILQLINEIQRIEEVSSKIQDTREEIAALKERMKIFKEKEVDEKLKRQVRFNRDRSHLNQMLETGEGLVKDLSQVVGEYEERFDELKDYESKENTQLFKKAFSTWDALRSKVSQIKKIIETANDDIDKIKECIGKISENIKELQDEFAEIKRSIDLKDLNPDDYVNDSKRLNILEAKLRELKKTSEKREEINKNLQNELSKLRNLWHEEYQTLQESIDALNERDLSIKVELIYRGGKEAFEEFLKNTVQGSGITGTKIKKIVEAYTDPIDIYFDLEDESSKLHNILKGGTHSQNFIKYFQNNISAALTFQVPNKYVLKYHGKDIRGHSLGQRASAIMVFLLARQENDLIIIDQPEDDIDNQSIYKDVISELNKLKGKTQFIFATHNPNIPVLGESEQVFTCRFEEDKMKIQPGSIDTPHIQRSIIDIMEGGQDAFKQRERKYQEWMQ